jgi:hypothetical protein
MFGDMNSALLTRGSHLLAAASMGSLGAAPFAQFEGSYFEACDIGTVKPAQYASYWRIVANQQHQNCRKSQKGPSDY